MGFPQGKGFGGPRPGENLTGMVKSYNRKGFGFIMCQQLDADVYFSRESLAPQLQTSDLAGEYVTFEVHRFPDGKLQARNLRPIGDPGITRGPDGFGGVTMAGKGKGCLGKGLLPSSMLAARDREEEDRSRDWYCEGCGERNFVKRFECYKCKGTRPRQPDDGLPPTFAFAPPLPVRRALSPHAGSRAMRENFRNKGAGKGKSRSPSRRRKRPTSSSGGREKRRKPPRPRTESSASSSSSSDKKKKKKRKKRKKSNSSDSSKSSGSASGGGKEGAGSSAAAASREEDAATSNPEVEKAKSEVLEKLLKLKEIEPKEARIKEWRALLRAWHPDKNPDRVEVATAVFQFLQKGKALIDA